MTASQLLRLACIYAEQDRRGLAEAYGDGPEHDEALALADQFREYRLKRWGRTQLEAVIAAGTPRTIDQIIADSH